MKPPNMGTLAGLMGSMDDCLDELMVTALGFYLQYMGDGKANGVTWITA